MAQAFRLFLLGSSGRAEELSVSGNVLTMQPQALALPRGVSAFRPEVDRALIRMYRAGEIAEFFREGFAPAVMGDAMQKLMVIAPVPE